MTGYVQVYTGDGKGKTTAALGLAVARVNLDVTGHPGYCSTIPMSCQNVL